MAAKFITAPDRITAASDRPRILIIDAEWADLENLTFLCMTKTVDIDFYVFAPTSIVTEWLDHALEMADIILLNDLSDRRDLNNNMLLDDPRTVLFGGRNKCAAPIDYVIETLNK